jgi:hypothetical protein
VNSQYLESYKSPKLSQISDFQT